MLGASSKGVQHGSSTWKSSPVADSYDTKIVESFSNTSESAFEHDICQEWEIGRCTKGDKCRFQHFKNAGAHHYGGWLVNLDMNLREEVGYDAKKEVSGMDRRRSPNVSGDGSDVAPSLGLRHERPQSKRQLRELEGLQEETPDRVRMFEELGKKRRNELATTEKIRETHFIKNQIGGEGDQKKQRSWAAGILQTLGRRTQEQRHLAKNCLDQATMQEAGAGQYQSDNSTAPTAQYIVLESNLVIYGAGIEIHGITPGYDLCQISMELPIGTTTTTIMTMFREQGLLSSDFHILRFAETKGFVEAIVLTTVRFGQRLERNRTAFANHKATFHVRRDAVWTSGTMKGVQPYLTLSWDSSSADIGSQPFPAESASIALAAVYDNLFNSQGAQMESCCLLTPETGSAPNQVMLMVEFDDWDNALKADRNIRANRSKWVPSLVVTTPNPYQWSIAIPDLQYVAQIERWLELSHTQHKGARIEIKIANDGVVIHVHGDDMASAGALKVRVEKLARGEILEGAYWHPSFAYPEESAKFMENVIETARVHLTCNADSRTLVVYGESESINGACKMIKAEANRREQVTTKTTLTGASVDFFVKGGFEKVRELVGEDKVDCKITSKWSLITMKGGEEATHHLRRLIEDSLVERPTQRFQAETTCPVCFTDTLYPEMLECGHGYCAGCLNLFLKAAADNKKFPIVCVGEGATCNVPIALSFIRRLLPHYMFKQLIEAAFAAYLEQNSTQFQYCKTPDCRQTYRRQSVNQASMITCPSCFVKTCSSCLENHANFTCEEYRALHDSEEQERLNNALASKCGYKRCPRCAVWVEKTGGCNHMSCKCGAHICWVCLRISSSGEIYNHIQTAH